MTISEPATKAPPGGVGEGRAPALAQPTLLAAIGLPCPYCGETMDGRSRKPSRDHVHHPRARAGHLWPDNSLIVCQPCNGYKGSRSLSRWLADLWAAGDARAEVVAATLEAYPPRPEAPAQAWGDRPAVNTLLGDRLRAALIAVADRQGAR